MCELLGMSANVPTDVVFSFTGLMRRGGETGPHRDGWGIAFYDGRGVRVFHDPQPGADSEIARLVQRYPIRSEVVIGHIRQANVGQVCLSNTHPFVRELWGHYWCFAHNGQVQGVEGLRTFFQPVGDTDSEAMFCDLLNRIRAGFVEPPSDWQALLPLLLEACAEYRARGVFNILLSNGDWLFSYCSTRLASITRRAPFGAASLRDADVTVDFREETTARDIVTVIATEPLTSNEAWDVYAPGEWRVWVKGECVASPDRES